MNTFIAIFFALLLLKVLIAALIMLWLAQTKGYTFKDFKRIVTAKWSAMKSKISDAANFLKANDDSAYTTYT